LIEDGATLQAGIGKLPGAIMAGLTQRRGLSIHSGLIGDWVLPLMDAGALADQGDCLKAGVILGSHALQARMAQEARLRLIPIAETHGAAHLGAIERFTSLNAALEVDLFGQINCEFAGLRTLAGVGGAVDFLRGARLSSGGKPIVMVQSLGKQGETRIVPRLSTPSVSIARSDAPILVTEHGAIDLEPLDTEARAQAIISLAAPQHRADLSAAWAQHRGARA
jgi:acyl-CoA hydrolase